MENWKPIPGFPTYEVSSFGRVRRVAGGRWGNPGKILKCGDRGKGYLRVMLRYDGRDRTAFVHHLVAEAYLGPRPSPIHEAAHMDGNRQNNALPNIRWVTRSENHRHKQIHGTTARGERQGSSKLTEAQVRTLRASSAGEVRALATKFGVSAVYAAQVRRGKGWRHVA